MLKKCLVLPCDLDNEDKEFVCLNLGCGDDPIQNYINCDIEKHKGVDIILDFDRPLPFKNSSFHHIAARRIIAHSNHPLKLRKEIERVLKPLKTVSFATCNCDSTHRKLDVHGTYMKVQSYTIAR